MSATELHDMAADASTACQVAKSRLTALYDRYGKQLEDIKFAPITGNDASDYEEAIRNVIDLLGDLTGMAEEVCAGIENGGSTADRDAAIEAGAWR